MDPNQIQGGVPPELSQMPVEGSMPMPPQGMPPQGMPPQGMPQQPMGGAQPMTDEQKQELLGLIEQIKAKLGSLKAVRFASSNATEKMRLDLLKKVFKKLQIAGVDLTNRESVANFIMKLKETNPELADNFEKAMDVLLGGESGGGFSSPEDFNKEVDLGIPPQNNMNNINQNNENMPPGI